MKITGTIESIATNSGARGKFFKTTIAGKTFNAFEGTDAFQALDNDVFEVGEHVEAEYAETHGEYKGKQVTYKNLQSLVISPGTLGLSTANAEAVKDAFPKNTQTRTPGRDPKYSEDPAKSARISDQWSINASIEYYKMNSDAIAKDEQGNREFVSLELIFKTAERMQEKLEEWKQKRGKA